MPKHPVHVAAQRIRDDFARVVQDVGPVEFTGSKGGKSAYFDLLGAKISVRVSDHKRSRRPMEIHVRPDADLEEIRDLVNRLIR